MAGTRRQRRKCGGVDGPTDRVKGDRLEKERATNLAKLMEQTKQDRNEEKIRTERREEYLKTVDVFLEYLKK